jgi:hypothetical protein
MFSANPSFFTMRTRIERTDQGFVDELSKVGDGRRCSLDGTR